MNRPNRSRPLLLAVALSLAVVGFAWAGGPRLVPAYRFALPNCAEQGTTSTTLTATGSYLVTVTDTTSHLCIGDAGCDVAGHPFNIGERRLDFVAPVPVSCRSGGDAGDFTFTLIAPGT